MKRKKVHLGRPSIHARQMMGKSSKICSFLQPSLLKIISLLIFLSFLALVCLKVDEIATLIVTQTKTIAGHNLRFMRVKIMPKVFSHGNNTYMKAFNLIKCKYSACRSASSRPANQHHTFRNTTREQCPSFYQWIHQDLSPWEHFRISQKEIMEAKKFAAFRVVIVDGRMYVDLYYACYESRTIITIWGLLQLLKRYPGMVPDVDMMFDCTDKPSVDRADYMPGKTWPPPPLFRYCTDMWTFDIPFPDWSFWGWPETNIQPWDEEFTSIKRGSLAFWTMKKKHAYWKGNPFGSPVRGDLFLCNDTKKWTAEILNQNWKEERDNGFKQSKLADQCKHMYKLYVEGLAWSVSLKYILSCGSMGLLISPQYHEFFSRGLFPTTHYWHVSRDDLCRSINVAVQWGNRHQEEAETIAKSGQEFIESLNMGKVYDYMYHLINEYSKLQDFKPTPPTSAQEVCDESVLCFADPRTRELLKKSTVHPSSSPPCTLPTRNQTTIESWVQSRREVIHRTQHIENVFT